MTNIPEPTESALPPEKTGGGLRYITVRTKETTANQSGVGKDERLWCFEPTDFVYDDEDSYFHEISDWFCFDETEDVLQMETVFYQKLSESDCWLKWSEQQRVRHIRLLLDQLDLASDSLRMDVYRSLGYVALGAFGECKSEDELSDQMQKNAVLLYRNGALASLVEALHRELGRFPEHIEVANSVLSSPAVANLVIRPVDTLPLRLVMTPLYVMFESLLRLNDETILNSLRDELGETFPHINELLVVTLFDMLTRFCNGDAPHYPIRKVVLLLWKALLASLGGLREAHNVKNAMRKAYDLPEVGEFTTDVCREMRPASPPPPDSLATGSFMNQVNSNNASSANSNNEASNSNNGEAGEAKNESAGQNSPNSNKHPTSVHASNKSTPGSNRTPRPPHLWPPKVGNADLEKFMNERRLKFVHFSAPGDTESLIGLPQPIHEAVRVLKEHLYCSLAEAQMKEEEKIFRAPLTYRGVEVDYEKYPAEKVFAAMLPSLPQYCIAVLKLSLAAEPPPPSSANSQPAGGASGNSRTPSGALSVLTDCVQLALTGQTAASVASSLRSGVETSRHRESILKGLAAIIILLLKHFKAVHVLHFELISQHLVFANALPLLIRLLSHNLCGLAAAANSQPSAEFPSNVLGYENRQPRGRSPMPSADEDSNVINAVEQPFNWRVVHTAVNLLRILNKLVKGKQHRVALLHSLRCAGLLKRTIRLKQSHAQLYALKLLKIQSRYLGRQWRRQNMHTISAIYERVRHRLTDDWAYGALETTTGGRDTDSCSSKMSSVSSNGSAAGPSTGNAAAVGPASPEFQAAESQLRSLIDKFHARRYHSTSFQNETACAIDTKMDAPSSLLMPFFPSSKSPPPAGENRHVCTDDIKCHCAVWSVSATANSAPDLVSVSADFFAGNLSSQTSPDAWIQREVFDNPIDWDRLLLDSY